MQRPLPSVGGPGEPDPTWATQCPRPSWVDGAVAPGTPSPSAYIYPRPFWGLACRQKGPAPGTNIFRERRFSGVDVCEPAPVPPRAGDRGGGRRRFGRTFYRHLMPTATFS
jgi:hypothetical protein